MNFKFKPLSLVALATATVLSGCGTEEETIEKTRVFDPETNTGLWCKLPDVVQTVDADFHPLTEAEITALQDVAVSIADPNGEFTDEELADFVASFNPYTFDYGTYDLYGPLGLTMEEEARQAIAKEEAREFKIGQKQDQIFGDGFDEWFDEWFATVPYTDYLGKSQRLPKATLGMELSLSAANNGEQACYTPPTECPNYLMVDESGTYNCIVPEENPLADEAPALPADALAASGAGNAVLFFRKNGEQTESNYTDITIHTWNNSNCTAYNEETSTTNWGSGKAAAGIDENHGIYWILDLVEGHDTCGNIIVYNKTSGDKFITQNDAMLPLGNSGDPVFHNLDNISFFQEGFPANLLDGAYLANQHPYFGAAAGSKSCGWGTTLDEAGEACIGQAIDNCPTGTYAVGVGQVDIASKCVAEFNPDETTLYLRGGFNGWGNPVEGNDFAYKGDGVYRKIFAYGDHPETETPSEAGTVSYFFKVADADWSEPTTYGGIKGGDLPSVGGSAVQVTAGEGVGQDMSVSMAANTNYQFIFDASDVSAATLKIDEVPVQAFPSLYIGNDDITEMSYASNKYSVEGKAITAGTYQMLIADPAANFILGGAEAATSLELDTPLAVVADGEALTLEIAEDGEYDFILDYSDADAPTLLVQKGVPYGSNDIYIRGTMTGWGDPAPASDQLTYDKGSRTYSVLYGLEAGGNHNFKFASQSWGGPVDQGYGAYDYSSEGETLSDNFGNIQVTPSKSTVYEFSINFDGRAKGEVKVAEAPIYIRGGIYGTGDWAADETMRVNFEPSSDTNDVEASHVYSSVVTTTGSGFFKIADADWGGAYGFNYGASQAEKDAGTNVIELGTPFVLTNNGQDLSFPFPAGTYRFSFDHTTETLTVTEVNE